MKNLNTGPGVFVMGMLVLALAYAELVFWELGPLQVAIIVFLFFLPLLWVGLFWRTSRLDKFGETLKSPALASIFLISITTFIATLLAMEPFWDHFFPGLIFENLALGLGFHQDTAFHAALTRGIMETGLPTTGQYGFQTIQYHFLAHYFDAAVLTVAGGVNPLQAASLLYFLKTLVLVTIWVGSFMANSRLGGINAFLGAMTLIPAVLGSGIVASSPSLWISVILTLVWVNVAHLGTENSLWLGVFSNVAWLAAISYAKVSTGLVLALFMVSHELLSSSKWARSQYPLKLLGLTLLMGTPFAVASVMGAAARLTSDYSLSLSRTIELLQYGGPYLLASVAIAAAGLAFRPMHQLDWLSILASSLGLMLVTQLPISTSAEEFQFFPEALYFLAIALALKSHSAPPRNLSMRMKTGPASPVVSELRVLIILFLTSLPVAQLAPFHPLVFSQDDFFQALRSSDQRFVSNYNSLSVEKVGSISRELRSGERWLRGESANFEVLIETIRADSYSNAEHPALILSVEYLADFEKKTGGSFVGPGNFYLRTGQDYSAWAHGLLFYAATGIPLVYAKPKHIESFGFERIPSSQVRKTYREALTLSCATLPQSFDYLIYRDLESKPTRCPTSDNGG